MNQSIVEELKLKHPGRDLMLLTSPSAEVVALAPQHSDISAFKQRSIDPKQRATATESLVMSCIVHPSREELRELLERKPLLVEKWGDELVKVAGYAEEIEVKKL